MNAGPRQLFSDREILSVFQTACVRDDYYLESGAYPVCKRDTPPIFLACQGSYLKALSRTILVRIVRLKSALQLCL